MACISCQSILIVVDPAWWTSRRAGWRWVHLATDGDRLAGAYPAFHLWWMDAKSTDSGGSYSLEHIGDLDLGGGRLLILGLQRNEAGALAADGKIAWLGRLGADLTEFRPVLPSRAGPGASTLQDCALLLMSKVRFLADGSFVVVPGVDPGIFLFDTTGRLVRTWETAPLNLDQGCLLDEAQRRSFATDLDARMAWLDRRRVIDEVVPLGKDIGLIVRSRIDGTTRWDSCACARRTAPSNISTCRWSRRHAGRTCGEMSEETDWFFS